MSHLTPHGVRDVTPEKTAKQQRIHSKISDVFSEFGYAQISTPLVEYEKTLSLGLPDTLSKRAVRLIDDHGDVMVLRPDHTTPIARFVSSQMTQTQSPLRLSYIGPIYQRGEKAADFEVFQAGVELIGHADRLVADIEMIRLIQATLAALGFEDGMIDIGHVAFSDQLSPAAKNDLLSANYIGLGNIPARGGQDLAVGVPELHQVMEELSDNLVVNQGLVKDLSYYTGIIFEASVGNVGAPIITGGRYDSLLGQFGHEAPAIGFSVSLNALYHLEACT